MRKSTSRWAIGILAISLAFMLLFATTPEIKSEPEPSNFTVVDYICLGDCPKPDVKTETSHTHTFTVGKGYKTIEHIQQENCYLLKNATLYCNLTGETSIEYVNQNYKPENVTIEINETDNATIEISVPYWDGTNASIDDQSFCNNMNEIMVEEPFNIWLNRSSLNIDRQAKSLTIDGRFWATSDAEIPSGDKYFGFSFNTSLSDGDLWFRNYSSDDAFTHLDKTDFTHLDYYRGYNDAYYTSFPTMPVNVSKEFRLRFYFNKKPKTFIIYFGTASTVVQASELLDCSIEENSTCLLDGKHWIDNLLDWKPGYIRIGNASDVIRIIDTSSEFDDGNYSGNSYWNGSGVVLPIAEAELEDDLVGYWKLDEEYNNGTDDIAIDYSYYGNNGTTVNDVTLNANDTVRGGAYEFDGDGDYILLTDNGILDMDPSLTIIAWIYPKDLGGAEAGNGRMIFTNYNVDDANPWNGIMFGIGGFEAEEGDLKLTIDLDTLNSGTNHLTANVWQQVAATVNSNGDVKLYKDAVEIASGAAAVSPPYNYANCAPMIGASIKNSPVEYFNGTIDEFLIFNRSLSASEIANLYANRTKTFTGNYTSKIFNAGSTENWTSMNYSYKSPNAGFNWTWKYRCGNASDLSDSAWSSEITTNQSPNCPVQQYLQLRFFGYKVPTTSGSNQNITPELTYFEIAFENALPTHDTPLLNATSANNYTTDNLTCYNQSTADENPGDNVKNIYNWYVDDAPFAVLNMPFEGIGDVVGNESAVAKDYSGFGNNGTVTNATFNSTGGYDERGAYEFDGDGDCVEIAYDVSFNLTNEVTVSHWVYVNNFDDYMAVFEGRGAVDNGFYTYIYTDTDDFRFRVLTNGTTTELDSGVLTANTWYHLVGVYNGTNQIIYINGVQNASNDGSGYIVNHVKSRYIGLYQGVNYPFNGTIDDVLIFNRALSAEQVWQLYIQNTTDYSPMLIVSDETASTEEWKCEITPNDGTEDGAATNSTALTIQTAVDAVSPTGVGFLAPTPANDTNLTQNNYLVNVSFFDANPETCVLEITNTSGTINYSMTQGGNTSEWKMNTTHTNNMTHFTAYCNDTSNNLNHSETRSVNISAPLDTCTPTAGANWAITISDNCSKKDDTASVKNVTIIGDDGFLSFINYNLTYTEWFWGCTNCKFVLNDSTRYKDMGD